MTIFRCERLVDGESDRALAGLGPLTLARTPDGSFVEISDRAEIAVRALAFAGVRATPVSLSLAPARGTSAAIGRDLVPLAREALSLDLVHVRPIPLASETRRLLRSRLWLPPTPQRRTLCRALLKGEEVMIGWRRRAWSSRAVLRSAVARRTLRPVVFDVGAIGQPPEHRSLVADGVLARWLFG